MKRQALLLVGLLLVWGISFATARAEEVNEAGVPEAPSAEVAEMQECGDAGYQHDRRKVTTIGSSTSISRAHDFCRPRPNRFLHGLEVKDALRFAVSTRDLAK